MADIEDKFRGRDAPASDLRTIAGAWFVCLLIAALALAFSGDLQSPGPAAIATVLAQATL